MSPQWATPERRAHLVRLFLESGGFCMFGHRPCKIPSHHYEYFIEGLIAGWVAGDREQRQAEWEAELREMHRIPDRHFRQGHFDPIRRELFLAQQPLYYLVGMGVDALTFRPVAKVRIPSTYVSLFVDIGEALQGVSRNKRRKALRYGKTLPKEARANIEALVRKVVAQRQVR